MEFAGTLQFAIDIVAESFSVVDGGDAIPLAEGMQQFAIQKGAALVVGGGKAVQAPLAVNDANLKEHAVGGILAGGWIDLLQVEEALGLSSVGIGRKMTSQVKADAAASGCAGTKSASSMPLNSTALP